MFFFNTNNAIDLGCTMVENMFINNFMISASGSHIKVYIYAFSLAQNPEDASKSSNSYIAKVLGLPTEDVLSAWDYWETRKIIKKHFHPGDNPNDYDVEFISIRQLYIEGLKSGSGFRQPEMTTNTFVEQNDNPSISAMFHDCEALIMREIQYKQRKDVLSLIQEYGLDPSLIVKAFEYATKIRNISDPKYAMGIASAWAQKGLKTAMSIEEFLAEESVIENFYRRIYKSIGISGRSVAKGDRDIMHRWLDSLNLPMDLIERIINDAVSKTTNPNFKYFDTCVSTLHSAGISDIPQYEAYLLDNSKRVQDNQKKTFENKSGVQKTQPKSNKFNDIATNTRKYSNEELEKILLSNKRR